MRLFDLFQMELVLEENVYGALEKVDEAFSNQLSPGTEEDIWISYFFNLCENIAYPKDTYYELMELWESVEPYIWSWKREELKNLWVLNMIMEVQAVKIVSDYNELLDTETVDHIRALENLAYSIEDTPEKNYMVELEREDVGDDINAVYSLRYFDEEHYHSSRDFLMQKLYRKLRDGGIIGVVAETFGTTSRKVIGYYMKDFHWEKRGIKSKKLRNEIFEENTNIRRKSLLPGFLLDDLW